MLKCFFRICIAFAFVMITSVLKAQYCININEEGMLDTYSATPENVFTQDAEEIRTIRFNRKLRTISSHNVGDTLLLDLFADKQYKAVINATDLDINGVTTITAKVLNFDHSYCIMSISGHGVSMNVNLPELNDIYFSGHKNNEPFGWLSRQKANQIRSKHSNKCEAVALKETSKTVTENKPLFESFSTKATNCNPKKETDPATINLLVVYTPAAKAWIDATPAEVSINTNIAKAIALTNSIMSDSKTGVICKLVHSAKVNYTEIDDNTDLTHLSTNNDGVMDEVFTLKKTYNADIVVLFAIMDDAGLAWLLHDQKGDPSTGFNSCDIHGTSWTEILAHELGHNLGCGHHKQQSVGPGPGLFSYSAGWRWKDGANKYCCLMTYESGAYFPDGENHVRLPYFSSPDVKYNGAYVGSADADNALTIRKVKHNVAKYKLPYIQIDINGYKIEYGTPFSSSDIEYSMEGDQLKAGDVLYIDRQPGTDVGVYNIDIVKVLRDGTDVSCEYFLDVIPSKLTIIQKPVNIVLNPRIITKTYGDSDPVFTFTNDAGLVSSDFTGALGRDIGEDVDTYDINSLGTLTAGANYDLDLLVEGKLVISTKVVNITPDNKTKTYGDDDPVFTFTNDADLSAVSFTGEVKCNSGNAGTYYINDISGLSAGNNYKLILSSTPAYFTVTKRNITIRADDVSKKLNETDPVLTYKIVDGYLVGADIVTGLLTRIAGETVGSYDVNQGTLAVNETNYSLTFTKGRFTVHNGSLIAQSITWNQLFDLAYDSSPLTLNATASSGLTVQYYSSNNSIASVSGNVLKIHKVGTVNISAIQSGNGQYNVAEEDIKSIDIKKANQIITWPQQLNVTSASTVNLDASVNTGLPLQYSSADNNVATVSGNTVTIHNKGTAIITVLQAGNQNYNPATATKILVYSNCVVTANEAFAACQNTPFTWNNIEFDTSREGEVVQEKVLKSKSGCDSVITCKLTVKALPLLRFNNDTYSGCRSLTIPYLQMPETKNIELEFDDEGGKAGFTNETLPANGSITLNYPNNAAHAKYSLKITPVSNNGCAGKPVTIYFIVNESADLIAQKWSDVLVCDNSSNRFVSYQWFVNGQAISGEKKQYMHVNTVNYTDQYHVEMIDIYGNLIATCAKTFKAVTKSEEILLYPNPVNAGGSVTLQTGLSDEELNSAEITLFSFSGTRISKHKVNSKDFTLLMPHKPGIYLIKLQTGKLSRTFKTIVQ